MAKSQKRSNREAKKPKAKQQAAPVSAPPNSVKGVTDPGAAPKKKG